MSGPLESNFGWNMPLPPDDASAPPYPVGNSYPEVETTGDGLYPDIGFRQNLISRTKTYMECPICMEILMAPIYQCPHGHIICNSCIEKVEFCGECRTPLGGSRIRNVALEYICQSMEVKCANNEGGCEVVTTVEHLKEHMAVCRFRPLPFCSQYFGWASCSAKVTPATVTNHLRENHQIEEISTAKFSITLITPFPVFQSAPPQRVEWNPIIVTNVLDVDVVLKCGVSRSNDYISFAGYILGNSEDYKKYRVKFQLESRTKVSRLEWTGGLISFQDQNEELPNFNTFRVPLETLRKFHKQHASEDAEMESSAEKLKVKVAFWKLSDDDEEIKPFMECFQAPDGSKEMLEKIVVVGQSTGEVAQTVEYSRQFQGYSGAVAAVPGSEVFFPEATCNHCHTTGLHGVIYRCLQCPTQYFCKICTEVRNVHGMHLMVRVPSPDKQPLAEIVYECAADDIA